MDAPPLEVTHLVKRYRDVAAVAGVSFSVPRGTVFCLVGPNGAGKTTTLEIAQGLRKPTEGSVRLFGEDPRRAGRDVRRRIGGLPQSFLAFDTLTVRENLNYFADIYGVRPDVDALMESLGLTEKADARYKTLSGGSKRRVGIAATLVSDPELVFLDEPTAGVDPANRRKLWDVILRMKKEGRSVVLTTHYMDEAERLADEVAIIYKGRLVAHGSPDRVRHEHGGHVTIRIRGLQGALPEELLSRAAFTQDGLLSIPLESPAEGPLVIAEIVKSGVTFEEIAIREPNLDDAFVRLVGAMEEARA